MEEEAGSLVKFSFFAKLMSADSDVSGKKVIITDKSGRELGFATSDDKGKFQYTNLPLRDEYLMKMEDGGGSFSLSIINAKGENIQELSSNSKGEFVFNRDEMNKMSASGKTASKEMSTDFKDVMYFKFGMHQLNTEQLRNLDLLARYLNANPESQVTISSHTDSQRHKRI